MLDRNDGENRGCAESAAGFVSLKSAEYQADWGERAAVYEYEGGLSRSEAEYAALVHMMRWERERNG